MRATLRGFLSKCTFHAVRSSGSSIPYLPVGRRKDLLKLCRVQQKPRYNRRLRNLLGKGIKGHHHVARDTEGKPRSIDIAELVRDLEPTLDSPLLSSFMSQFIRNCPQLHDQDEEEVVRQSILKELSAAMEEERVPILDLSPIFSFNPRDRLRSIHPDIPVRKDLNTAIHSRLLQLRERLRGHIFYPRHSPIKGTSRETAVLYSKAIGLSHAESYSRPLHVTTTDLLRRYSRSGLFIGGCSEVRYAWKMNDLSPRVYYAMGGEEYTHGMFMQEFANTLVQELPATRVPDRFNLSRIAPIGDEEDAWIYDLTSFTSKLSLIKKLFDHLIVFFRGVLVTIIDVHKGPTIVDLGELLKAHVQASYDHPEFDLARILDLPFGEESKGAHRPAGMLGVYGNIVFSTFAHGLVLTNICGHMDRITMVGDDGFAVTWKREYPDRQYLRVLQDIGVIHELKTWLWRMNSSSPDSDGYTFLKRPADRLFGRIFVGLLLDFPNLPNIFGYTIPARTQPLPARLVDRQYLFVKQWCRLLNRVHELNMDDEELRFLHLFGLTAYSALELPHSGHIPSGKSGDLFGFMTIPDIRDVENLRRSWTDVLLELWNRQSIFSLPAFFRNPEGTESCMLRRGMTFESSGSRLITLGMHMHWLRVERAEREILLWESDRHLLKEFWDDKLWARYYVTVLPECPMWLAGLDDLSREPSDSVFGPPTFFDHVDIDSDFSDSDFELVSSPSTVADSDFEFI